MLGADVADRFFVHVHPADGGGREAIDFRFRRRHGDRRMAAVPLLRHRPPRRGQYDASGHLRDEEFALGAEAWLARFASFAAREPDARRAEFDLHLEGRTLTFVRGECSAADVADRFFVHAYATDGGREAIDFRFRRRGLRHGDRCMAPIPLPDYPATRLTAGRYDDTGHLRESVLAIGAGE